MGITTDIEYCDSTLNLEIGCDGCELWERPIKGRKKPPRRSCYAGRIVSAANGQNGFPIRFEKPLTYPDRAKYIQEWSDLTGKERKIKEWLNGYPRVIFLNDMGDTFTKELPLDWMAGFIPAMKASPHIFLMLTKRVKRMAAFWQQYWDLTQESIPENIWIGTTVTDKGTLNRVHELAEIPATTRYISFEPLLFEPVLPADLWESLNWAIVGFESGEGARKGNSKWMRTLRDQAVEYEVPFFLKQMGGGGKDRRGHLLDIPSDLRIRQLPDWKYLAWEGKPAPPAPSPLQFEMFGE